MTKTFLKNFISIASSLCCASALAAETKSSSQDWPAASPAAIAHWQSLRFGMFIHWGPVSLTGKEIGWSRGSHTPIEVYDNLYKQFNPTHFNADEWVSIAKAAGMKYIVLTTKHHDGFCLWDTKLTDYNIMNSPFRRDVVKELAAACKKQGVEFGAYYSVMDNYHPDYPLPLAQHTAALKKEKEVVRPHHDIDAYEKFLQGQITELIQNYGPLLTIWNDVPRRFDGKRGANTIKLVRQLQPDILINNRSGDGGDYDTPEQKIGKFQMDRPWESCMTISAKNRWAWGGAEDGVKSTAACLDMLIRAAGGDGNVLLNVGPRPDGMIGPAQADRLKEVGAWLAKNGDGIYGTRGGPWQPTKAIASTRKGNTVYLHILQPETSRIELPVLPAEIESAALLDGGKLEFRQEEGKLLIKLEQRPTDSLPTVVKLILRRSAMDIPALTIAE
jgi:alpha-L-fucosidase